MWIIVLFNAKTGQVLDYKDDARYIGKVSCEKAANRINKNHQMYCNSGIVLVKPDCKDKAVICISARDYIPPARKK